MKKVLILSGSPRLRGNSSILCDEFAKGAAEAGHTVEKINVVQKKVNGCLGCNACIRNGGSCVQKDDMEEIREKMLAADVIVLASPIYYYSICSQLKAVLDRCYAFGHDLLKGKTFYYMITCAAPTENYAETMIAALRGFVCCAPESVEGGMVIGYNTSDPGSVRNTPAMRQAFELGKNI